MADESRYVVAHRFTVKWPVGIRRAPVPLKMNGDDLSALGQFGKIAAEAVRVNATVKQNERLAGAMNAVKDMLAIHVGKISLRHGWFLLGLKGKRRGKHCRRCGRLQEI